nr:PKD-like domain-containing protein [uncultured Mucilaginibacter sp.]
MKSFLLTCFILILSVAGFSQALDGSITPSSPAICSGAAVVLTANGSGGTPGYTYFWITTGENTKSITITTARTYTVRITDQAGTSKDISINIAANVTPQAPTAGNTGGPVCYNSSARLEATAPAGAIFNWYADPQGGIPLATGAVFNTPPITSQSTIYYVEATVNGCVSTRTGVAVPLAANPTPVSATICANGVAVLKATGASNYRWWDAAAGGTQVGSGDTFTTPILTQTTTYYVEGITASGCTTERVPVVATVTPAPAAPTVASTTYNICINSRANLQATGPGGVLFDWFDVAQGGVALITSPDYTTPILTANKTYWVQSRINDCIGPRTQVEVVVSTVPPAPQGTSDGPVCVSSSATLRVTNPTAGMSYQWFESATSSAPLFTGTVFSTPALSGATTFYLRAINGPCASEAAPIEATILPVIEKPTVSGSTLICSKGNTVLDINQPNNNYTYEWFDSANATTPLYTGVSFVSPLVNSNTTFYVQARSGNCTSARTAVAITLLPLPPQPTVTPVAAICYNTTATLVADNGTLYRWYTAQTGGASISSDRVFTTGALTATTTFYVSNLVDGCESDRTAITVTVNAATPPPVVDDPGPAVCRGTTLTLHAHASGGVLQWFSVPTGGNQVFQGPDYPVTVNNTTTFYVQEVSGACISNRTAVTVQVVPYTATQFAYSAGTYCTASPNQTPTIYVAGGNFSASPGLVWQNQGIGTINIAATPAGKYTVSYTTTTNGCTIITAASITITNTADAAFTYSAATFCQGGANPRPQFTLTSSGGVFSANLPGISINPSTGEIDLSASQPGNYIISNTVDLNPICNSADTKTFPVTIQASVVPNAGGDRYAARAPYTLSGSAPGATTVTWSTTNGLGTFTNPNSLNNAIYTPNAADNAVTFILSANDGGPCGPQTARVTINFINSPAAPITTTDTVCVGTAATLTAFATGATSYQWFDVATNGNALYTGANYTTAALNTVGVVKYWVSAQTNGVSGPRTEVDVLVKSPPGPVQVTGDTEICSGTSSLLVAASTNATAYKWFNADMFPVATGNTLSVPVFTNTSYFVQAEAGGCLSPMFEVKLTVKQAPQVVSDASGEICSGAAQNYLIKADLTGTTFTWARAAKAAINNNQPASGSGDNITEVLVNSTPNLQTVTYVITPTSPNGCSGTPFNYTVTVNPIPVLTSAAQVTVCNEAAVDYTPSFNPAVTAFSWSRDAVAGISNISVADQASPTIREALNNTTNAPVIATYRFTVTTANGCTTNLELKVTVNPSVTITSEDFTLACSNVPFVYQIASNVSGATYDWKRPAVGNNPARSVTGVTSINETLINNTGQQLDVYYVITPFYNGCSSQPFTYHAIFNPQPVKPMLNVNTPICEGNTLVLQTDAVAGATYTWTLPDGSSSSTQAPVLNINNVTPAHAGTYSLTVTVNGCSSEAGTNTVVVNRKPTANAGPDQSQCPTTTVVNLNGDAHGGITGGPISGVWTTAGTGTFSAINDLQGRYFPSDQDRTNGSVTLTLTSASPDDCTPAVDQMLITFGLTKIADAGLDQTACLNANVAVSGTIAPGKGSALWTSSGTGTFDAPNQSAATYRPSAADFAARSVTLKLTASAPGACDLPDDEVVITFAPPVTVTADASPVRYVFKGETITLHPTVSDENVTYLWTPATGLDDATAKNPVVTGGDKDVTYKLVVTTPLGCVSDTASVLVKVSPRLIAANTFTPNADGINDLWLIPGIEAYPNAVVDIYNRFGKVIYHSIGYTKPWDGTSGGQPVPFGVYYFVIDAKLLDQKITGSITVIR